MLRSSVALALALAAVLFVGSAAHADLPPPPGKTRVHYTFQIDGAVEGGAIVAFPISTGGSGLAVAMEPGRTLSPFQGWTPGLYLVPKADVASIPKEDQEAIKAFLASHAKPCLKVVPRVVDLDESANVKKLDDVIHVEVKGDRCEASLSKTVFTSAEGKTVEGGADAKGNRTAPAPIGKDLPSVAEAGFVAMASAPASSSSAASSPVPSSAEPAAVPKGPAGCAGCTLAEPTARGASAAAVVLAVAMSLARRLRRRRR